MTEGTAGVSIAGMDNDVVYRRGGRCRSKSTQSVKTEAISRRQDEQPLNLTHHDLPLRQIFDDVCRSATGDGL